MFSPQTLGYSPSDGAWMANYTLPQTGSNLEISIEGSPEAIDPEALALLVQTLADDKKLVTDTRLPQTLFTPWINTNEHPEDWTIEGIHCGRSDIYGQSCLLLWWWFLHPDDTYGCYHAAYDSAGLNYWPSALARRQW